MNHRRWAVAALLMLLATGAISAFLVWRNGRVKDGGAPDDMTKEDWLEKLAADDPGEAAGAVDALVVLGPDGLDVLMTACKRTDLRLHRRAVAGLARRPDAAGPLAEALPWAGVALVRLGAAAVPALQRKIDRGEAQQYAARCLGLIGPAARPAAPALARLAQDPNALIEARTAAARALGRIGAEPADLAVLTGLLATPGEMRVEAVRILEEVGPEASPALPALLPLCLDADGTTAWVACRAVGRMNSPAAVKTLAARLLKGVAMAPDIGDSASRAAGRGLAQLGAEARPTIPDILRAVKGGKHESPLLRSVLERLGEVAVPGLVALLDEPDPAAWQFAAEVLGLMGPRAADAVPALLRRLEDTEPARRVYAADALAHIDPTQAARAVEPMRKLLRYPSAVWGAARVLPELGEGARVAVPDLLSLLRDDKRPPELRLVVAESLGRLGEGSKEAAGDLKRCLDDPDLRRAAALALLRVDPGCRGDALAALAKELNSGDFRRTRRALYEVSHLEGDLAPVLPDIRRLLADPTYRVDALGALGRLDPHDLPAFLAELVPLLSSPEVGIAELAARLLAKVGEPALPPLREAIAKDDSSVRRAIAGSRGTPAFRRFADEPGPLLAMLADTDLGRRIDAAETLAELGARTEEAVRKCLGLLDSPEAALRTAAVTALGRVRPAERDRAGPHVAECLFDPAAEVRRAAAGALGELGRTDGLRGALAEGSAELRMSVCQALVRCGVKDADLVPVLIELARRASPDERFRLAEMLHQLDPVRARELCPELQADLAGDWTRERVRAAAWLVRMEPQRANAVVPFLVGVVAGWESSDRLEAAQALRDIGPPAKAALPLLRRAQRHDDDREVRRAAGEAVAAIRR